MTPLHKVTCFITRPGKLGTELILFRHPTAGIQIPAGTVNPGEDPVSAARREAAEETGLDGLVLLHSLGKVDEPPPVGYLLVVRPTPVYSHPDTGSFDWAHFRPGFLVEELRHNSGFIQVRYSECDRLKDPEYVTYSIMGWVPEDALTNQCIRHFFSFEAPSQTPDQWSVVTDNHTFELFWALLSNLPSIVPPQDGWLKYLLQTK